MERSEFLQKSLLSGTALMLPSLIAHGQQDPGKPAQLKLEIVKEFVNVSHGNVARTKEMLENEHLLLHVSYDWGGGDYESGIEACGHTGNKEIVTYLLGKGARYNIYLASMLGHLETVKNVLTFIPHYLIQKGRMVLPCCIMQGKVVKHQSRSKIIYCRLAQRRPRLISTRKLRPPSQSLPVGALAESTVSGTLRKSFL